ncbi:MAG: hypothetical protein J7621_28045 [Niastella sp.]|nr:hypothetical protein [Niastella sp.]
MSRQLSFLLINLIGFTSVANYPLFKESTIDKPHAGMIALPAPKGINSLCYDEWSRHKELIIDKRDSLQQAIIEKENRACRYKEKAQQEINNLKARVTQLDKVIELINSLEKSDEQYILQTADKPEGSTSWDAKRKCVVLTVGSTANFIHEITHGGQYEAGEIIFDALLEKSYLQDLYDETDAYKAQYAYDPASITGLKSNTVARTMEDITPQWVANLQSKEGEKTYREHGLIRVNINSPKATLLIAYPQLENQFKTWADNCTMKEVPNVVYKQMPLVAARH